MQLAAWSLGKAAATVQLWSGKELTLIASGATLIPTIAETASTAEAC